MTGHIANLARSMLRRLRPAPKPDPLAFLDGIDVPPGFVGRDFDITDAEGRVVATTRRQYLDKTRSMIG